MTVSSSARISELPPLALNGDPHSLMVTGSVSVTLTNILVGDVWLISGQSNADFPLSSAKGGGAAIATATNSLLRYWQMAESPTTTATAWTPAEIAKLNPNDTDAKFNYDFVKKRLEELKQQQQQNKQPEKIEPSEAAKQAKAKADIAVQNRDYKKALSIMEEQLAIDSTTRYYSDFIERLKEITDVQASAKP